jgi:hypothetical protein
MLSSTLGAGWGPIEIRDRVGTGAAFVGATNDAKVGVEVPSDAWQAVHNTRRVESNHSGNGIPLRIIMVKE